MSDCFTSTIVEELRFGYCHSYDVDEGFTFNEGSFVDDGDHSVLAVWWAEFQVTESELIALITHAHSLLPVAIDTSVSSAHFSRSGVFNIKRFILSSYCNYDTHALSGKLTILRINNSQLYESDTQLILHHDTFAAVTLYLTLHLTAGTPHPRIQGAIYCQLQPCTDQSRGMSFVRVKYLAH